MLTVVSGPPCSGKTKYVDEHRSAGDLVMDLDRLAVALGHPGDRIDWALDHPARDAARLVRRTVVDAVMAGQLRAHLWLVDTDPHPVSVRIWSRAGADFIRLDPGRDVCQQRAVEAGRPPATFEEIARWYTKRVG